MQHTVLFVDDEINVMKSLKRNLLNEDYKILISNNPLEALNVIKTHKISLVISDYQMPQINGIELLKIISDISPQTIRIILTGYIEFDAMDEALNNNIAAHLIKKPWSTDSLKSDILNWLREYH